MEKIKVNMNPNPLDVQTIHASQNDGEARQWEFELHNNGEKIDSSSITDQLVFKTYKGGTEQLLPENGSTPTTTPILADIQYPDGLRTDQYFTYRETPTTVSNKARIKTIKGQTLKWNQIAELDNTDTTGGITVTNNSDGSLTINGTATLDVNSFPIKSSWVNGHIYMWLGIPTGVKIYNQLYKNGSWVINLDYRSNPLIRKITSSADANRLFSSQLIASGTSFNNVTYFPMEFDLTQMFGETKADEILAMETAQSGSGIAYFKSFFPLDYYSYNSGSLIPFNGNGLKTVGKNLVDVSPITGYIWGANNQSMVTKLNALPIGTYTISQKGKILALPTNSDKVQHGAYYITAMVNGSQVPVTPYNTTTDSSPYVGKEYIESATFTITNENRGKINNAYGYLDSNVHTGTDRGTYSIYDIQIEFGSTATSYEPYTENTLSLPISTYFPTGMKDVPDYTNGGKIYDEMTSNKADTRVGSVDLGTLNWTTYSSPERHVFRAQILSNMKQPNDANLPNAMCSRYEPMAYNPISANDDGYFAIGAQRIVIIEHDYTDPVAFKESLSNVYLYYELATPTETSFTTASLVTENAEIPLSNNDGTLIGKCTEQLSENPGFIDAKIKLTDADGECYSNKLQLHVERSPQ